MQEFFPVNKNLIKTKEFWGALAEKKLKTTKCINNHIHWPPRTFCNVCYTSELVWIDLPLEGTLKQWTEVNAPERYIVGILELKPHNIRIFGKIIKNEGKNLKTNQLLNIKFELNDEEWFYYFQD